MIWKDAFFVLLVTLTGALFFLFRLRKRNRQLMQRKDDFFFKSNALERALVISYEHEEKILRDISSKLHDDVGAHLTSALMLLNSLERNLYEGEFDLSLRIRKQLELVVKKIRSISKDLDPPSLVEHGLDAAVQELCEYVSHPTISILTFRHEGEPRRLGREHELVLFRATQELINNAFKHSCAYNILVSLNWKKSYLAIDVLDNGKGFAVLDEVREGNTGLKRTNYALEEINAKLMFPQPIKRKGTHVRIEYTYLNGK